MIDFDARLRAVRDISRVAAEDLRGRALAIDADPDAMDAHLGSPWFTLFRQSDTPVEYRESIPGGVPLPDGLRMPDRRSCLENVVGFVETARGDAATVLACPCPGLAGVLVELLGSDAQRERFYTRLHGGRTWAFFAMTEAAHGSDAGAMESRFVSDGGGGWLLFGGKRFVGNGARGGVGVVFARTGRSALSVRAALVEVPVVGWSGRRLETVGLRGAALGELEFDGVPVSGEMMLGEHLPVTRRGLWGAVKTFNQVRLHVAAAAVGTAMAMAEYVGEHRKGAPGLSLALARTEAARELVYEAAALMDRDAQRGYLSSAAKLGATRMVVEVARWASGVMGPSGLLEHPLLEKWTRDAGAFEFMDGTGNVQRLHVARGYQAGDADGRS
ncbi:acyl-CoA dehydrogenase family protein [Streptomyces sp. SL13]|uniref:Acyl-CoA dehydrogenase family protein n=1 Tax=Streptantibioticus silvisoli TaxID=2705255 RepID=A0AA90H5T3_9ACTN|nr:acyl-CoA dehydrogenase family protein [Streptantibioticus silvisoli]MDI5970922.1 acyl-CoA dehydrogenase family protein [Streptantibioticus silvisoli]